MSMISSMSPISPLSILLALGAGLLTVLSPCVLPVLPLVVGRSLQSHQWGPAALVVGLVSGFAAAGSLLGLGGQWLPGFATGLRGVAIGVLLLLGLLMIFPQLNYRLQVWLQLVGQEVRQFSHCWTVGPPMGPNRPVKVNGVKVNGVKVNGVKVSGALWAEFWIGTQLGLLWTPCAGPVLGSILVLAAVRHQFLEPLLLLTFYGIGAGIPLILLAYAGRHFGRALLKLRPYSEGLAPIGGITVILTALAILMGWDVQVQLWLAPFFPSLAL
jgi:cytochrome c-type biogenesis protein